jgi:hypothetical protein
VLQGNINAQRYINDILEPDAIQHDNARPHTALVTRDYL